MIYTTKEIAEITGSKLIGAEDLVVKSIEFDSRNLFFHSNNAFIAINTSKNSGEKYILSAVEKGIKIIISEHILPELKNVTWILTENSILFLQRLAKFHLAQNPLKTIGITGSNGKTVVKEWLYQSVCSDFNTVKSPKSFNSQLGLPLSILQINKKHELGIFEVGISKPKEMKVLEDLFSPQIGVLTHIGTAHSSNFEDKNDLISEKISLFKNSEVIIFNGDGEDVRKKIENLYSTKKLISFGLHHENDVFIENFDYKESDALIINYFSEKIVIPFQNKRDATLSNALCVIAILKELNFDNEKIIEKINKLKSVEMRLESVNGLRNNIIINDSYNLDLDSLKIAYHFINEYNKPKNTLILTDFVEVKDPENLYREVAHLTNQQNFNRIFLIGKEIAKYQKYFTSSIITFDNTKELIASQFLNQIENELILLKGARKFAIEKVTTHLELQKHDTTLEVNLNAILNNINTHKSLLKPKTKMMAMVKAFSYGLGGYEIAEFLQHHHIDYLGVAYADEGIDLRKNGISTPIMVMNPEQNSYSSIIDYNLEPEIYSFRVLDLFCEQLVQKGITMKYPIHIKLETGMHRLGFKENEISELVQKLKQLNVKVASIFSHLSSSDDPNERHYTLEQAQIFKSISHEISIGINSRPIFHLLNTAGIVNYPEFQFGMVRIGIGMVGISADKKFQKRLQNAVSFKTVISQISYVEAGNSVGYNRRFKTETDQYIATIPVGYADGIPRSIGNKVGKVGIRGELFPIVGNICMDMMMIDLGKNNHFVEGEEVFIFSSKPSLEDFASYCGTIPYEVLTSISRRVKRIYLKY